MILFPVNATYHQKISQKFGERKIVYGNNAVHEGIDFACPERTSVYAAKDGYIILAHRTTNSSTGYGNHVIIDHMDGTKTLYAHLLNIFYEEKSEIHAGNAFASSGGKAGTAGAGRSTGPHLHFEYWDHGKKIDPEPYFTLTPQEYMQKLDDLEKRIKRLESALEYGLLRQVEDTGEVLIHPQFKEKDSHLNDITLSLLAKHSLQPLLREIDADKLKKDGWVNSTELKQ